LKNSARLFILLSFFLTPVYSLQAQLPSLQGKTLGVFISSQQVSFSDDYYMWINQFLTVEEDRSWGENVKNEFLIRLGEQLTLELAQKTGADSVYFLNRDLKRGRILLNAYQAESGELNLPAGALPNTDMLLMLEDMQLSVRTTKSVIIRSNRMLTHRIKVKKARLGMSWVDLKQKEKKRKVITCYDERESGEPPIILDILQGDSPLGAFLSELYSAWWLQVADGMADSCE
jgi:hypothetical protein